MTTELPINDVTSPNAAPMNPDLYELDVLVVGAGIFGSVIGAELERIGRDVFYIDAQRPMSGSRPAACLMKPSWLSKMGKEAYQPALDTLERLYGLETKHFLTRPLGREVTAYFIPPSKILGHGKAVKGHVSHIGHENLGSTRIKGRPLAKMKLDTGLWNVRANLIVVATGVWTDKLFPHVEVTGQAGAALTWANTTIDRNFISLWAPYRQLVGFNGWESGTAWCGDGSAILTKNFNKERIAVSAVRCAKAMALPLADARTLVGIRPYTKKVPCYLEEALDGVWIATGGAKNGTVAAGWAARQISKAVS